MLTYVINTSENRTLESDKLFDLAGYNKIRWMNCTLNDISEVAQEIFEKQNVLGADSFRIAVLVDFFGFDRIRAPYGSRGYVKETGVDISLYLPYIEIYLLDHLVSYLDKREVRAADVEVYYVQNTKLERYEFLDNAHSQLAQVIKGTNEVTDYEPPETYYERDPIPMPGNRTYRDELPDDDAKIADYQDDGKYFDSFELYCTPTVSLKYDLSDYPYGFEAMTLTEFFKAFASRNGQNAAIRRHYYISNYGGGQARAAFDTLTLSLHLIRIYEREEFIAEDGEIEINTIDPEVLKNVLVTAWNKINIARADAKGSSSTYYGLKENIGVDMERAQAAKQASMEDLVKLTDRELNRMTPHEMYAKICYYHGRTPEQLAKDKREEYDVLMKTYLAQRDESREANVVADFKEKIKTGEIKAVSQFPPEEEYLHIKGMKEDEISQRFDSMLKAAFQEVDFSEEKAKAKQAFKAIIDIKKCMHRNIIWDIVFIVCSLIVMITPYVTLQLRSYSVKWAEALILGLEALGLFAAIMVLAIVIVATVFASKLYWAKRSLKFAYRRAYKKECDSLAQIRKRFNDDLPFIERTRYELRQLAHLYEANLAKDANIRRHRELLEELDDILGSMLNKLDVNPVLDANETIQNEFDINRPIRARENSLYRIFSLETIDKLFVKKDRKDVDK